MSSGRAQRSVTGNGVLPWEAQGSFLLMCAQHLLAIAIIALHSLCLLGPHCPNNRIVRNSSDKSAQQFVGKCTIGHRRGLKWCVQFRTPGEGQRSCSTGSEALLWGHRMSAPEGPLDFTPPPILRLFVTETFKLIQKEAS